MPLCLELALLWSVCGGEWYSSTRDWLKHDDTRAFAGGIYLSFLIPGVMSLIAMVSGDNKIHLAGNLCHRRRAGHVLHDQLDLENARLTTGPIGPFRRYRWIVIVLYLLVLIFGAFPELAKPLNLLPLQVESILLALLILIAHGLTWEFMTQPEEQ